MLVWYAAYGSNLSTARFATYLRGGRPPGATRVQVGARDRSDPRAHGRFEIERALWFGRSATTWGGGGVCFLDGSPQPSPPPQPTLGRVWLITVEQLADVWIQENGGPSSPPDIDLERLARDGHLDLPDLGWYRRLIHLGLLDGHPVATITTDAQPPLNPGGPAYLRVVAAGLRETWGLSTADAAAYLAAAPGNLGSIDGPNLERLLESSG